MVMNNATSSNNSTNLLASSLQSLSTSVGSPFIADFGSYLSANIGNNPRNKANNLIKSFHIVMDKLSPVHAYNASFFNSTSLTSNQANDIFIANLLQNVDQSLQNIDYTQVGSDLFGANYRSFNHADSNNCLQDALLCITASLDSSDTANSFTVEQLKHNFMDILLSQGLPINSMKLQDVLRGMSALLASQMGNVGHLVNTST
jgi:hypothetical protein